jgi:hypothetical protein
LPGSATAQNAAAQLASGERVSVGADSRLDAKQAGISRLTISKNTRQADVASENEAGLVQTRTRRGQTLMIVGGVGFMAGLIIGDDAGTALAIGGAVIGLYGLYQWASTP